MRQWFFSDWGIQTGLFAALWAHFVIANFQLFHFHTGRPISYYPRGPIMGKGNSANFKIEWDRGHSVPGPFNLDHLHPFKPLLWWRFSNFYTFILGGQFLLTQRANNREKGILPTSKLNETESFECLGHSNLTICSPFSPFCFHIFAAFALSYWEANSY